MDPSDLVDNLVREIALQGEYGASLDKIWHVCRGELGHEVDVVLRAAIWRWLSQEPRVIFTNNGTPFSENAKLPGLDSIDDPDSVRIYAQEDEQWISLTHRPKAGNPLGIFPFRILSAVSRAGPAGLTAVEISRDTGQDPRSLFGRVQRLADLGLVGKFAVVKNRTHTNLVIYERYLRNGKPIGNIHQVPESESTADVDTDGGLPDSGLLDKWTMMARIMGLVKTGVNGLRLQEELFAELGFKARTKGSRQLSSLLTSMENLGVVKRVFVFEPSHPEHRYRCVQYVKDLPLENGPEAPLSLLSLDGDELEDDQDPVDDLAGGSIEEHGNGKMLDLATAHMISGEATSGLLFNLYYPLENQVLDMSAAAGIQGLPIMDLRARLTGPAYARALGKFLELYVTKYDNRYKAPSPRYLGHLNIVAGADSQHKLTFYRYFSQVTHNASIGRVIDDQWGTFSSRKSSLNASLRSLSSKLPSSLDGTSSVIKLPSGEVRAYFHGDRVEGSFTVLRRDETAKVERRGRPRKKPKVLSEQPEQESAPKVPALAVKDYQWRGGRPVDDGFQGISSQAIQPLSLNFVKQENVNGAATTSATPPNGELAATPLAAHSHPASATPGPLQEPASSLTIDASRTSLSMKRRDQLILTLLAEAGGALAGGSALISLIDQRERHGSSIDRKTVARAVKALVAAGKVKQTFIATPTLHGAPLTRYLLRDPSLPEDSPRVDELKRQIVEASKAKRPGVASRPLDTVDEEAMSLLLNNVAAPRRILALRDRMNLAPPAAGMSRGERQQRTRGRPGLTDEQREQREKIRQRKAEMHAVKREVIDPRGREPAEIGTKLFRSVAVAKSIVGRGNAIDWDLVVEAVPELSPSTARRRWPTIRQANGGSSKLRQDTETWKHIFMKLYAEGKAHYVPIESTDFSLASYVELWEEHADAIDNSSDFGSRSEYEAKYGIIKPSVLVNPLESFFSVPSMTKQDDAMVNVSFGIPVRNPSPGLEEFSDADRLVRSVTAADQEDYSETEAARLLLGLGEEETKATVDSLCARKVLQFLPKEENRVMPGRNLGLSERVNITLVSKFDHDALLSASEMHDELAEADSLELAGNIPDAHMISLLELIANDKVDLEGAITTGRLIPDYRSRMIAKEKLDFPVTVRELDVSQIDLRSPPIPLSRRANGLVWQLEERLSGRDIWARLAVKMLNLIAMRPHITLPFLLAQMRPGFAEVEVRAALEWLEKAQLVAQDNGYLPTSRWYAFGTPSRSTYLLTN